MQSVATSGASVSQRVPTIERMSTDSVDSCHSSSDCRASSSTSSLAISRTSVDSITLSVERCDRTSSESDTEIFRSTTRNSFSSANPSKNHPISAHTWSESSFDPASDQGIRRIIEWRTKHWCLDSSSRPPSSNICRSMSDTHGYNVD